MKRIGSYICFGLLTVALSCTMEVESRVSPTSSSDEGEREVVEVTVRVTPDQTRATDTSLENKIESAQVFIFADGVLESVGYSDSDTVTLNCYSGNKDIYAVANYSELELSLGTKSTAIEDTVVELAEEKTWNVMYGKIEGVQVTRENAESLSAVTVKRVGARIVIHKVTNSLRTEVKKSFRILRAYITNVAGDVQLYGATVSSYNYSPSVWYNKMGNEEELPAILSSESINLDLRYEETTELEQYFYCYPNYTEEDFINDRFVSQPEWCPRYTRLILETYFDDVTNYYIISIGGIQSGCSYEVEELSVGYYGWADPEGRLRYSESPVPAGSVAYTIESGAGDADFDTILSVGSVTEDEGADSFPSDCERAEISITGGSAKIAKYRF